MEATELAGDAWPVCSSRDQGLRQDAHSAAADEAVVPAVVVVEVEDEKLRAIALVIQDAQGTLLDLGFDATSAERAALAAIGEDEHRRPRLLRRRAARLDQ